MMYALFEDSVEDIDKILDSDSQSQRKILYNSPNYLKDVEQALTKMLYRGYLE